MFQYHRLPDGWKSEKPIVIYGLSRITVGIISSLVRSNNNIIAVTDSVALNKDTAINNQYWGFDIWNINQLYKNREKVNVVIASYSPISTKEICEKLIEIGVTNAYGYRNMEVYDWFFDNKTPIKELLDEEKIQYVFEHLEDQESKNVLLGIKNYKLTKKVQYIKNIMSLEEAYFISHPAFQMSQEEVFVDGGVFIGDTIIRFHNLTNGKYKKIIGFEPNAISYHTANSLMDLYNINNVIIENKGLWDSTKELTFVDNSSNHEGGRVFEDTTQFDDNKTQVAVCSLDDALYGSPLKCTYVKMDIEGSELIAIDGCKKIIARDKPRLAICAYHSATDFYELPYKIMTEYTDYHVLLRHHSQNVVDTICYAYVEK